MKVTGNNANPTILIIDDEIEILYSLADLLRKEFHVITTDDPSEAIEIVKTYDRICIALCDQRMPDISGTALLNKINSIEPRIARVLITGYSDIEAVIDAVNFGKITQYITKPWDCNRLIATLKPIAQYHLNLYEQHQLIEKLSEVNLHKKSSWDISESTKITKHDLTQDEQLIIKRLLRENTILQNAYEKLKLSYWHIEKIHEVLPICLSCGKVKNKKADWQDLVSFLKENSLFLSHGYCPECVAKKMIEMEDEEYGK